MEKYTCIQRLEFNYFNYYKYKRYFKKNFLDCCFAETRENSSSSKLTLKILELIDDKIL